MVSSSWLVSIEVPRNLSILYLCNRQTKNAAVNVKNLYSKTFMAEITCSFCGKTKKEVSVMISGINAHICERCIGQAQQILNEENKIRASSKTPKFNLIKPRDMKEYLDQFV